VAVDLSWPLLVYARRRSRRLPLVQADMRTLPFHPGAFNGAWAAASLIHLPQHTVRRTLRLLLDSVRPGGILGATLAHGRVSGFLQAGWIPGRFISRWRKAELAQAVSQAGWEILSLKTVMNRERKGRWLNLVARRPCP
jgi:SAM-dependent methyltransferase